MTEIIIRSNCLNQFDLNQHLQPVAIHYFIIHLFQDTQTQLPTMQSDGKDHAWEPGGSASVPPLAVDPLSVPGELFHFSVNHKAVLIRTRHLVP